jgi:Putative DNA-binding domain
MSYDSTLPQSLKEIQQWFGNVIGQPIDNNSCINPISPSGNLIQQEACNFILPSPTLLPHQRIEIYNQQYWWRLMNALHEDYPLVTRLFGYCDFNQTIGVPYLTKYPPDHWSLNLMGKRIPQWIQEEYQEQDKQLVYDASLLDSAFIYSFSAKHLPPIDAAALPSNGDISTLMKEKICLQTHLQLLSFNYDLPQYRVEFLEKEPEYWIENDFPKLVKDKKYYFSLYRNAKNNIAWIELTYGQYSLLKHIQKGTTIEGACEWLETQEESICNEAMENLHLWFQEWILRKWLVIPTEDYKI